MSKANLLKKHNGTTARDITDRNKKYARQIYHEYFVVFDNEEDYKNWVRDCELESEYAFYDPIRLYTQDEVDKICDLREKGKFDEIRY